MAPRFSVLTPVFDPEREHLEQCLTSMRCQSLRDWEHIIVDDASTSPWVLPLLEEFAAADPRVRVISRETNGGIVAASNDAFAAATGEFVALLDHDDELALDALARMSEVLTDEVDVAYSDHDLIRPDGKYATPSYKPDFSPERLRSQNYITHLLVARRALVASVGGFRDGYDGAQDHDLVLRLTERARGVAHVPRRLYHWRQSPRSVTTSSDNKPWAFEAGVRAVADHCERVGIDAVVELTPAEGCYRVRRELSGDPLVSVIIPTRGTSGRVWGSTRSYVCEAVRSLVDRSTYQHLEFVIVADAGTPAPVIRELERIAGDRLRVVEYDRPFNFSEKVNLGAIHATGHLLLMLNDDTELIEPTSIETLAAYFGDADDVDDEPVAMVGCKLLFDDGTIQHGGHIYHHDLSHACLGWPGDSDGPWPLRPLAVAREASGVTAAATMVRRDAFEAVGGLTPSLPSNFNDVDLCLKLRATGYRILWTPWASWYHFESKSRNPALNDGEYEFINQRWHYAINNDPYYNPNLAPHRNDWLERPFRSGAAPVEPRRPLRDRIVGAVGRARRG